MKTNSWNLLIGLLLAFVVAGCSTNASGIKNPKYSDRAISSAAVLITDGDLDLGLRLEAEIINQLKKRNISAIGISKEMLFVKDETERTALRERLIASGVKEVIYIALGDIHQSEIAGYQLTGTTNAYGNTAYSSGTAVPIQTFSRDMRISCQIDDLVDGYTIWKGSSRRHAQGLLFIGDGSMVSNGVAGLMERLNNDGML